MITVAILTSIFLLISNACGGRGEAWWNFGMVQGFLTHYFENKVKMSQKSNHYKYFVLFLYLCLPIMAYAEEPRNKYGNGVDVFCGRDEADWKAVNAMGFSYYQEGDLSSAIHCYQKSIETNPQFATAHNNLGVVYLNTGDLNLAAEHFRKAVDLNPSYAKAIFNLAVTSYRQGNFGKAKELVVKANSVNPDYVSERVADIKEKRGTGK